MAEDVVLVGVVGDDHAHRLLIETLADLSTGGPAKRTWVGVDGPGWLRASDAARLLREQLPRRGAARYTSKRIGDAPAGYGSIVRDAARLFSLTTNPAIVLYLFDEDGEPRRAAEVSAAVAGANPKVIAGVTEPVAEAWVIALVGPHRPERLRAATSALGFDPARKPHQLSRGDRAANRDAKRILRFLVGEAQVLERCASTTLPAKEIQQHLEVVEAVPDLGEYGLTEFYRRLIAAYKPTVAP